MADRLLAGPDLVRVKHQCGHPTTVGVGEDVADQRQPEPVPFDVEAALQLRRLQAVAGHRSAYRAARSSSLRAISRPDAYAGTDPVAATQKPPQWLACCLGLDVPQGGVQSPDSSEDGAPVATLEHVAQHPVVQRSGGSRVLALDGGKDPSNFADKSRTDTGNAFVGLEQQEADLDNPVPEHAIDVADRTSPVLGRRQGPVSGDTHVNPS